MALEQITHSINWELTLTETEGLLVKVLLITLTQGAIIIYSFTRIITLRPVSLKSLLGHSRRRRKLEEKKARHW
jgi:hypothetical protein